MSNFNYLQNLKEFKQLYSYCIDAEELAFSRPALSVISSRKALEYVVKAVYELKLEYLPKTAGLLELIDNFIFKGFISNEKVLTALHYIRKAGNNGAHNEKVSRKEALFCVSNLHYVVAELLKKLEAIKDYEPFNKNLLTNELKEKHIEVKEEVKVSSEVVEKYSKFITKNTTLNFTVPTIFTESETRELLIDQQLKEAGWEVLQQKNVRLAGKAAIEIEVKGMPNNADAGFIDYVLFGRDGKPLAIVEAKRTSVNPIKGEHQARLYAECIEKEFGVKPVIYYTNGYETRIIDGIGYPSREVFGFHTLAELELLIFRQNRGDITDLSINQNITDRAYQKMAITSVCEHFNKKHRKALIVMATGTGKTRVSISLVDVLMRNKFIKNVLFLADRTSLVKQAKKNFAKLLPEQTICELSDSVVERDFNARIMFSTYQTMINYIDADEKEFSIGRFDLIIIDEAHRSIFNKYKAIFTYFDSLIVGLTATPRSEVEKSTYEMFGLEEGLPNYHYELKEAVKDGFLVDFKAFDRTSDILKQGIVYSKLNKEEKEQYEQTFALGEEVPEQVEGSKIFRYVYNVDTVRKVLQELMQDGLKVNNGDKIGKTIIFAYNHKHALMIVEQFRLLYPQLGDFCALIDNYVTYANNLIERFEVRDNMPQIAVSVDMLDTGIDVPDVLNLVFF